MRPKVTQLVSGRARELSLSVTKALALLSCTLSRNSDLLSASPRAPGAGQLTSDLIGFGYPNPLEAWRHPRKYMDLDPLWLHPKPLHHSVAYSNHHLISPDAVSQE